MTKLIVDASAWIEYFSGSEKGKKFASIIENRANELFTSSATVAEVISKVLKEGKNPKLALDHINNLSSVLNLTQDISLIAGRLHFENKKLNKNFGMLDAFIVATAQKINAKILTGDYDFKPFKETIFI